MCYSHVLQLWEKKVNNYSNLCDFNALEKYGLLSRFPSHTSAGGLGAVCALIARAISAHDRTGAISR